ncbi:MAG: CidA/LrgA family protein [Verrucomicrobia bacterium]|nr:CidA/LrgA family protein [Verrucomicrobiota bacterium]
MLGTVALLVLFGCQLAGEMLHRVFSVPVPGPVMGMLLLTLVLLRRPSAVPKGLATSAGVLLQNLGLFFVPAGVGIVANFHLIRQQWLPICVALVGSTCLSLLVTAVVVNHVRIRSQRRPDPHAGSAEGLP